MLRGMFWQHQFRRSMIMAGVWLLMLAVNSCGGPKPAGEQGPRAGDALVTRLARWTLLIGAARTTPSGSSKAHLVWMKPGAESGQGPSSQKQLTRMCRPITSVMPLPGSPAELLLVEDGRLRLARITNSGITDGLVIATTPSDLRYSRLLAVAKRARELELLVTLEGQSAESDRMTRVVVDMAANKATLQELIEQPSFQSQGEFYKHFTVPICQKNNINCLVIGSPNDINAQTRPGEPHDNLVTLVLSNVFDAIWDMRNPGALLVLTRCPESPEPE